MQIQDNRKPQGDELVYTPIGTVILYEGEYYIVTDISTMDLNIVSVVNLETGKKCRLSDKTRVQPLDATVVVKDTKEL